MLVFAAVLLCSGVGSSGWRNAIIGLSVGAAAALLLLVTLARPWPAPAQPPAAQTAPASLPAGYVGAETCKGCHEEAFKKF